MTSELLVPNMTLSHYRIVSRIGAGGMGEVYKARDERLGREVAIKVLPADLSRDEDRLRRFMQEARAASALNHPNIITVYDIGESEAGRFIVMELVTGRTLRAVIAEDNSIETLRSLGAQMAKALSAAHAASITHRDIKPDNIMVREDGYVKVLDFGLARLVPTGSGEEAATILQQTQPGQLMGTVKYMSPEQARGETVSQPSDIFSLGLICYELATGQHPFNAASLVGLLNAIITDTPTAPSRLNPQLTPELERLILRMLHKEASQRPTAAEVDTALGEIEIGRGGERERRRGEEETLISSPSPAISPSSSRHTVGREPERHELREVFNKAKTGRASLLCVAGEPGIGKTTLVEDFLAELTGNNQCTIARGRCSERLAGTEAYLPLLEALEGLLAADVEQVSNLLYCEKMKQIAPTWYAQVAPLSGDSEESARLLAEVKAASQERMKRELASFLQAIATPQPLVIFFDDLHWADVSTIDLLSFLAGKFDAMRLLIVVTYRPSDMLLAKHPFLQIKPDLQARGLCRELLLEFLNEAEIAEYLALEFPRHAFPSDFAKLIHAKTEGSPLFMADLVRYLRDRGVIAQSSGAWKLEQTLPDIERELPESVRGMIERKIAQLSEDDRKLLTAASVQGYEFDSAVVAQALNLEADEIEERLEKLERVFAFVKLTSEAEFPNGTLTLKYRFVHVLYQNALYASLRATRKATLSRDTALALETCYGIRSASVANELALLWEAARDYARASDAFLQAARNAAQINANREAVQLAERGLAVLSKLPETPERNGRELGLQLTLGLSLQSVLSWAAPEAGAAFNQARQLCEQMGDDPRLIAALCGVTFFHLIRTEYETAQGLCERMMKLAEQSEDPVLLIMASMVWSCVSYFQGNFISTQELGQRALALDSREYHEAYLTLFNENIGVTTRRMQSFCQWTLGYADQALALAQESVTLAMETTHPLSLGGAHFTTGATLILMRDWPASQNKYEQVFALAEEYDLGDFLNYAITFNALALTYQEPTEAALERALQAIAFLRDKGEMNAMTWCLAMLGEVFGLADRSVEGLETIVEALALVERTGERCWEAEIWRIKGELLLQAAASNAQAEAERCYHQALDIAQQQSAKAWELRAATSLARLWQQQGKREEAQQPLAEIYGWFTEGFDTADLKDAKALLDELHTQIATSLTATSDNRRQEFNLQVAAVEADTLKRELMTPAGTAVLKNETPSIAVLPFVNISNDADNEYFCDGLAEELLNALSKIEALRVAARTSAFSFKGKETDIREIGQRLNVSTVLEGSVRKAGNRLRITAQLVSVADGYHLWSERYDREMTDIFDIQDEITLAIVEVLKVKLLGAEKARVLKHYTDNTEAYQLYLQGRYHFFKLTGEGFRKSIEYYQAALAIEPDYALALAGLGLTYGTSIVFGHLSPEEGQPEMQAAITRALEIDDDLAEVHYTLAMAKFHNEWDWQAAEQEFKRTLELHPGYASAHQQYSLMLAAQGREDEALAHGRLALELDPLSLVTNMDVGFSFLFLKRYDEAQQQGRKLTDLEPNFFGGHVLNGAVAWHYGHYEQAITLLQRAVPTAGPLVLPLLGCIYGIKGEREKAQEVLDELMKSDTTGYVSPTRVSLVYGGMGELDRAFVWLERACEQRAPDFFGALFLPVPGFHSDPRFAELLRRIGLRQ